MRKILKLIKSEWIKLFSKVSTYIIIFAVAVIPAVVVLANYTAYNADYAEYYEYHIQEQLDGLKQELSNYEGAIDRQSLLDVKLINENISLWEEAIDVIKNESTWRKEIFAEYIGNKYDLVVASLIKSGYTYVEIQDSYYSVPTVLWELSNEYANDYIRNMQMGLDLGEKDINYYINQKQEEIAILKEKYNRNSYVEYAQSRLNDYKILVQETEKDMVNLEKELTKLNKQNLDKETEVKIKDINQQIEYLKMDNEYYKTCIYAYQYVVDNSVDGTNGNWQYEQVVSLLNNAEELLSNKYAGVMSEADFEKSDEADWYSDYDQYVYVTVHMHEEMVERYQYSLENSIDITSITAKDYIQTELMVIVIIGAIFVAGSMVSHEFSTGTIRFLLTRPVKRWKILFSKLFILVVFICILFGVYMLSAFVTAGLCGEFTDFSLPIIEATFNGKAVDVVEKSFVREVLKSEAYSLVYISFFAILAFVISTVLKSTVFSTGLGMGSMLGCIMVASILPYMDVYKRLNLNWLKYTPVPYCSPTAYLQLVYDNPWKKIGATANLGLVVMLAYSIISLTIAFIVFNRRDVKNQ